MVTKALLFETLEKCATQAVEILELLVGNHRKAKIDDLYKKLEDSKHTLYGDSLFKSASLLIGELETGETIGEEEKGKIEQLVSQIDLASFAYNISRLKEYKVCTQAFFSRAVSPFNKYTKNEIQLFLSLHLYNLRQEMNAKEDASKIDLIKEHFPQEPSTYYFDDTKSSQKESGKRQVMMAVDKTSEFLCSKVSDLDNSIRFGALVLIDKFLKAFIQYRLDERFSFTPDREIDEGFPETEDEVQALVDEVFDEDFIDKAEDEAIGSNSSEGTYIQEGSDDDDDDDDEEENDSKESYFESDSDKSSTASSSSENNDPEMPAVLPINEDGEEDELPEEEEEEQEQESITRSTRQTRASASRRRITDEQPGARSVTAEEAGFSDDAGVSSTRRSSNASAGSTSGSQRRRRSFPTSAQNSRKRKAPENRYRRSTVSGGNADNASVNGEEAGEEEEQATPARSATPPPPPPPKFHICDDGRARPVFPIPKIREKAQRWTPEAVQALEEGLRYYKRRVWTEIRGMFKDKLGSYSSTQIKDKAVNEVKRRQKLGISLEGFEFVINPI